MDIYSRTSEQHTYTPGNIFLLEEGEATLYARLGQRKFSCPNSRSDIQRPSRQSKVVDSGCVGLHRIFLTHNPRICLIFFALLHVMQMKPAKKLAGFVSMGGHIVLVQILVLFGAHEHDPG